MSEEDSVASVLALQQGREPPAPRLERARSILEGGVGHAYNDTVNANPDGFVPGLGHGREGRARDGAYPLGTATADPRRRTTSTENRAVAFANQINALALGMTKLRAFKERQDVVFNVLIGVGG